MIAHAVANSDIATTSYGDNTVEQPKPYGNLVQTLASARNRVTMTVLDALIPDTMTSTATNEIGGILEYDGPTVTVEGDEDRLGLEVRDGDLIFAFGGGVWIGTVRYDDMPAELDSYNFITSGTRDDYNSMVEQKLEVELQRQNEVMAFLMAA